MRTSAFKLLVLAIVVFILSIALALGALYLEHRMGTSLYDQMNSVNNQAATEARYSELSKAWEDTAEKRARLESQVLSGEKGTIDFLADLDRLAATNHVTINTTALEVSKTAEAGFDDLQANFTIRGSDTAVLAMVRQLELLSYDSQIDSLKYSRTEGNSQAEVALRIGIKEE